MIQSTSLEAFYKIQSSLGRAQKQVLDALRTQPNATNAEIAWMLKWTINRVTPRVLELRSPDVGLVEEVGRRKCRVTGRPALAWRAVPMPSAFPEKKKEQVKPVDKSMPLFI